MNTERLTQIDNLPLSKLLPKKESDGPCQVEGKLKGIEGQGPLLSLKAPLSPDKI